MIMKDGQVIEHGDVQDVFTAPKEQYTELMLMSELQRK